MRTNQKFSQDGVFLYRVETDFVALDVTRSVVPGDTEAGPGRLRSLKVPWTFVR